MLLLLAPLALADNVPCTAQTSGPGWRSSITATVTGGALTKGHQEVTLDIPAIDQGDSPYEYNGAVNQAQAPMARVRIVEDMALNQAGAQHLEVWTPEVYAPVDSMLAGINGTDVAPLRAALRLVAAGQPVGWLQTTLAASPTDLGGSNIKVYTATLDTTTSPALNAMAQAGSLHIETWVPRSDGNGGRVALPDHDDTSTTDLAGSFVLDLSALTPAMASLQTLQNELGGQLAQGKCGDLPAPGGGKK